MVNSRTLIVLSVITLALILGIWGINSQQQGEDEISRAGQPFIKGLDEKVNDVNKIEIKTKSQTSTLVKQDGGWTVAEKGGFPADVEKVSAFLVGSTQLKIIEPKTKNPERFSEIHVEDLEKENASSTLVNFFKDDSKISSFFVGKQQPGGGTLGQRIYVRQSGDNQSWLVEGALTSEGETAKWLASELFKIDEKRIEKVDVAFSEKDRIHVKRSTIDAADFTLDAVPQGKKIKSQFTVNNIAQNFATMTLDDVVDESKISEELETEFVAKLATYDGLELTLEKLKANDKVFVRFNAREIEPSFSPPETAAPAETAEAEKSEKPEEPAVATAEEKADPASATAESSTAPEAIKSYAYLVDKETLQKNIAMMNTRFRGKLFSIAEYRLNNIGKPMDEIVENEASDEEEKPGEAANSG